MLTEATSAGFYTSPGWGKTYPKIQILTVDDLLKGKVHLEMPPAGEMFKAAKRTTRASEQAAQGQLFAAVPVPTASLTEAGDDGSDDSDSDSEVALGENDEFED